MRAVVQRVKGARVEVEGRTVGSIDSGLLVLLGVSREDGPQEAAWLAGKISTLRMFPDADDKLNLSVKDVGGEVLVVSQFTLWGDCRKGTRPSYTRAAGGDLAEPLYETFCEEVRKKDLKVATGQFGAMMDVHLVNQGPVTLLLDTGKTF
jgi:D-tyrosyl-tRNA(Tyr) deacylase